MRRVVPPSVCLALCLSVAFACRTPDPGPAYPSEPPAEGEPEAAPSLSALEDRFFEEWFARDPVGATAIGEHRYDGKWPDLSPKAREDDRTWAEGMLEELERPRDGLTSDEQVDLDVLTDVVRQSLLTDEAEKPWTTNPLAYAYLIGAGIDDLIMRDFAPVEDRAVSVAERLEGLPALVEQAIANLAEPAAIKAPHARVALAQLAGVKGLIHDEVPARTQGIPAATAERIQAAVLPAVAAVERLEKHIAALSPEAKGQWRLGADAFARKLALTLQTDLSAQEVYTRAKAEHDRVRARMATLARELYVPLFGAARLKKLEKAGGDDLDDRIIRQVLDALAADHVPAEQLRDAAEENLERLEAFVKANDIVPMDEREVLKVIWTPPHERGVAIAGLDAPAPLDAQKPGLPSFYIVQPVPEEWTPQRRESFLREYNHFMLEILSIHEAIPGHFVQLYYSRRGGEREPSKIRRVFSNGPFVEGWAVYTEHVMVEKGYAGKEPEGDRPKKMAKGLWAIEKDPKLRAKAIALHGQKFFLRTITNAIIDHEIHAGDMDEEAAVAFMVDRAFQEEGEARAKWVRAQLSSTQLSTYFVGATAWFRLREQAEQRAKEKGEPFDMAAFHEQALSHGAPPVHRLPELMGWT